MPTDILKNHIYQWLLALKKKINDMYTVYFMQVYVNKAIMIMGLLNDWEIVDTLSHEFGKAAA